MAEGRALPLPRFQFSILHLMAATMVAALALAPIPFTMRNPQPEYIVAAGAYEIIFLPHMGCSLLRFQEEASPAALGLMKPGPA